MDLPQSDSFYEILDGSIYDKNLLKAAQDVAKDGEIGYEAAKCLWTKVGDDAGRVSDVDIRTMDYIMQRYKFERTALYFLKEAIKLEKQAQKVRAKELSKATGSPIARSPKKSLKAKPVPKSPVKRGEQPYEAILRITEEINNAKSVTEVKRLTKQLAVLSPAKNGESAVDGGSETLQTGRGRGRKSVGAKDAATPPKTAGRGRGRKAGAGKGSAGEEPEVIVVKKPAASLRKGLSKRIAAKKVEEAEIEDEDFMKACEIARVVAKRPAAKDAESEAAPVSRRGKGGGKGKKKKPQPDEAEDEDEEEEEDDEDDDEDEDEDEEEEEEDDEDDEEDEEPVAASPSKKKAVLKRPASKEIALSPKKAKTRIPKKPTAASPKKAVAASPKKPIVASPKKAKAKAGKQPAPKKEGKVKKQAAPKMIAKRPAAAVASEAMDAD